MHIIHNIIALFVLIAQSKASESRSDENGTISHTICDGDLAELSCPTGKVISIVIGNYGRFSTQVCIKDDDNLVASNNNCRNEKTKSILEKKCNGKTSCRFIVDTFLFDDACPLMSKYLEVQHVCHQVICFRCNGHSSCDFEVSKKTFINDPCPATSKYLEVKYNCVVSATTTTSTTSTTTSVTTESSVLVSENQNELGEKVDVIKNDINRPVELYCEEKKRRGVLWPKTKSGLTAAASCPEGTNGRQSWECTQEGSWNLEYPNTSGCESDWVGKRSSYLNDVVNSEDASGIPEILRQLVTDTRRPIVGGDVPKVLHLLERIVEIITEDLWTRNVQSLANKGIVDVLNSVLRNTEVWSSWENGKRKEYAARMIMAVEKAMVSSSEHMSTVDSNVIVQPAVSCEISHKIRMSAQPTDYVLFPSSALWGYQNVDNVNIPKEAIQQVDNDETQVYFSSFDNIGSQMSPRDIVVPTDEGMITRKRRVVSKVVGATLIHNGKMRKVEKLHKPTRITFYHRESAIRHMESPTCVWWNYHQLDWSPTGCKLSTHNFTMTVCECDHLTHFAVLMDIHGHKLGESNEAILTMLTYTGCAISIFCLFVTFFAYLIFSKNGGDRVFIHENLCLSLAVAEITFLAGISRTENSIQCSLIAMALMYLFLSALTWMLLEGYHIYRMIVEVFPSEPRRFVYLVIGYIFPAVITFFAWIFDSDGFGGAERCWLRTDNNLILFFVGPASFILLVNTCVLIKTLCVVYQHARGGYLPCRHDIDSGRSIRSWVKGSMALACLLGVTWTFGLLWIDDEKSIIAAYVFTICNSLQGLFIFLFHVIFSDKMRKDFWHWMARRGCVSSSSLSSPTKRNALPRDMMSPGMGSSTGSEFLYPSNEKYMSTLDTTNQLQYNPRIGNSNIPPHLHRQIYEQQGVYDYATITYGDMIPNRIAAPPAYQRMAFVNPEATGSYTSQHQLYNSGSGWHHRPPPEFSPPPPPPSGGSRVTSAVYGSNGRRPPSSKMSDDSAYSDGGSSSMLTTEVTPQGQTVLRIDLNKPNMYCQEV